MKPSTATENRTLRRQLKEVKEEALRQRQRANRLELALREMTKEAESAVRRADAWAERFDKALEVMGRDR